MVFFKGDIMKNTVLFSILIIAIMVMAGAFVYFQVQKTSGYPDYHVNVYLNYTKGNITVDYGHNSINSIVVPSKAWFNVSLKAYSNYSYSFYQNNTPLYFNYSGLNNSGFYTGFLDKNVTVSLNFMGTDLNVPDIHKFNITLSGVPSGTGTYQQLLTIDPATYDINSHGSNVLFYDPNGTELYAWLQSINSTSASYWIKNFNGSSTINMQVLPSFENLFSANGYLGEAPQLSSVYGEYFNANYVFLYGQDFAGTTEPSNMHITSASSSNTITFNNGVYTYSDSSGATGIGIWTNQTFPVYSIVYAYTNSYYGSFQSSVAGVDGTDNGNPYGSGASFGWDITPPVLSTIGYGEAGSGSTSSGISGETAVDNLVGVQFYNTTAANAWYDGQRVLYAQYLDPYSIHEAGNFSLTPEQAGTGAFSDYNAIPDYLNITYIVVASPLTVQMPTFTIGTGNSTAFTHEIILESD